MRVFREVLAEIVKDATPAPGQANPLSEQTRRDIRDLFGLIAEREAELAEQAGLGRNEGPYFTDQQRSSRTLAMHKPKKD